MTDSRRPDPEKLLQLANDEERSKKKGKLKIFFGACAGVGKTYAMLHAAHEMLKDGVDVLIGVVETHGRVDTQELVDGIPRLPTKSVSHRGVTLQEFDLDAALARAPEVLIFDELPHSNPIGSRHPKRWQDVRELIDAGIDVYTALNVQHLESLNDVVARITGISVKETVPDLVFDEADDITLVDISTDELLERLAEGKVYLSSPLREAAAQNFFKKSNLIALREMALRRTAERVDAQMKLYNVAQYTGSDILTPRLLVCVGPDMLSVRLVRATKRMADRVGAPWYAAYVQNEQHTTLSPEQQERLERTLRLAEQMGGKIEYIYGNNATEEITNFAKKQGITRIVVGKQPKHPLKELFIGSLVDGLIRQSDGIEITVIASTDEENEGIPQKSQKPNFDVKAYAKGFFSILLCTFVCVALRPYSDVVNIIMIYLMGIAFVATSWGRGPSIMASVLSVLCFNLFFVEPQGSFSFTEERYFLTFSIMLVAGLFISSLSARLKKQALASQARETTTAQLYAMTREFSMVRGHTSMAEVASRHMGSVFNGSTTIWLPDDNGLLSLFHPTDAKIAVKEEMAAKWAYDNAQISGKDTMTMPSAEGIYFPLKTAAKTIGVIGLTLNDNKSKMSSQFVLLAETFASVIAASLERANQALQIQHSALEAENEKLRSTLLNMISQDLLVPLTSLTTHTKQVLKKKLQGEELTEALTKIRDESQNLMKLLENLVSITKHQG